MKEHITNHVTILAPLNLLMITFQKILFQRNVFMLNYTREMQPEKSRLGSYRTNDSAFSPKVLKEKKKR